MNDSTFPIELQTAIESAAHTLGLALMALGYPNAGKNAAFAEANLIAYLAHELLSKEPTWNCYVEPSFGSSKRIDLVASNTDTAIAVEAKTFGGVAGQSSALLNDVDRLLKYQPELSRLVAGVPESQTWWNNGKCWGLVLIGSHAGNNIKNAWNSSQPDSVDALLIKDRDGVTRAKSLLRIEADHYAFKQLLQKLDSLDAKRGCHKICAGSTRWQKCSDAYLLWAAFSLNRSNHS